VLTVVASVTLTLGYKFNSV